MLRRFIMAAALMAMLASPVAAGEWRGGVKAGFAVARFSGDFADIADVEWRDGFVGGGWIAYAFTPRFAVQSELLWVQKGADSPYELTDSGGNVIGNAVATFDYSYLEVPVLVRATGPPLGPVRVSGLAGPTFAFSMSAKLDDPYVGQDIDVNTLDVGVAAGLSFDFDEAPLRPGFEVRYTRGFSDLYDTRGALSTRNQVWTFMLEIGI